MPGGAVTGCIYLYIHDFRSSGVVRNALTYARRLALEHPTTLVAAYGEGFFRAEAERGPFDLAILSERQGSRPRAAAILPLRRWLRRQPPGVLLSMGVHGHPTVFAATRGLRHIRRIYRVSNEVAGRVKGDGLLRRLWQQQLIRDAARIVLVGSAMREHGLFAQAVGTGHAVAIPNGVDVALARRRALEPAPHPWLEEKVPVVLAVGRLRPQKNFGLLIEAVGLASRTQRMRLIIVGGGTDTERARLTALAGDFAEDFFLAGETDNVFAWMARAAVLALPSRWEGSALVLLEAMAVGTPVVASRLAGDAAQVLDEGRYGLLFDGEDSEAFAGALLCQTSDAPIMPGNRADDFSIARTADCYAEVVRQALTGER